MKRIPCGIVWHDMMHDVIFYNINNGFIDIEEWQILNEFKCAGFSGKRTSLKLLDDGFTGVCVIVCKMVVPP